VTEQAPTIVPDVASAPTAQKPTKKVTSAPPTKSVATLTDDEKRLARNAALRDWRKKNKDRVQAYMTEWRSKRNEKKSEEPTKSTSATSATAVAKVPAKKSKPAKITKKSKALMSKKGGRV